ncbi:MAG: UPF0280 family protein [Aestuariivita sp.]|nr:UPF0280 family protein [Aestuariivita sp.]MCY4202616.1 UPF0280 family protein [Aestuariivita sp.]
MRPSASILQNGRLHLHHGPIDLIVAAEGQGRAAALAAAEVRFRSILDGLVSELVQHRRPLVDLSFSPKDHTAKRMYGAARAFASEYWLTPMIAVAGSVADEVLAAMRNATSKCERISVNNGGDIAINLAAGQRFSIAVVSSNGRDLARINIVHDDGVRGIATSGTGGRSFSLGIADTVTVLAHSAAQADVAATLIANSIDLPKNTDIERIPANQIAPDSDLGGQLVVVKVPELNASQITAALQRGRQVAKQFVTQRQIVAAALFLQDQCETVNGSFFAHRRELEVVNG